jgi:hypothetical protein
VPLPRERSKQPYGAAEVGGFLALADAQPTRERRMRAAALVCLGASAGLIRGWCRIMGLAPRLLFTTCLIITRNQRITTAWDRRQEDSTRRAAAGLPPRTRRRRRKTLATLAAAPP